MTGCRVLPAVGCSCLGLLLVFASWGPRTVTCVAVGFVNSTTSIYRCAYTKHTRMFGMRLHCAAEQGSTDVPGPYPLRRQTLLSSSHVARLALTLSHPLHRIPKCTQ
ncbi:hypothetical protein CALCODRAFT_95944 [Calocera cornea HHB12733]|uniref:Secreted protein n=1 Tax=Calocera cornea HHB12733 TaxID=1353952 RepID=A0A165IJ94_9BASI|nr:hypothetical protein CALCODRAFT_95944 [Calocera cornea HHB12733]